MGVHVGMGVHVYESANTVSAAVGGKEQRQDANSARGAPPLGSQGASQREVPCSLRLDANC
ncbi:hypothetical protein EYF80_037309 [Liparis tanakae]|uniref:Uncharacterized protein n=1 Tax=Liparis tanakae TaxID=230148 RepID=A0A4Z2GIG2_9TELE|nr:hypothetical protein EYF80_037309 [Liparis tanakae]